MRFFDFHTHAFVDSLAERAMGALKNTADNSVVAGIEPVTDGTLRDLRRLLLECGISGAMILPIATKPTQQTAINNWAAEITGNGIYSCGSIHPDAENALEELERIRSLGLCGIKFHSEYQNFRPDEERMMPIYEKAAELGLFVVFHGGWDPLTKDEVLAVPESFAHIAERVPELTIIAAHMGGMKLFDDAEKYIAGKYRNIYLDTGFITGYIDDSQLLRIIRKHGADRILFASDAPWDDPRHEIELIKKLPLTDNERELIFYKNAERLLGKFNSDLLCEHALV